MGKSTLLNILIGEKVSIVSPRPQTTRNRTLGVKNLPDTQIVFIDTPGIYKPDNKLGEYLVSEAVKGLSNVDIIYFVVNANKPIIEKTIKGGKSLKGECDTVNDSGHYGIKGTPIAFSNVLAEQGDIIKLLSRAKCKIFLVLNKIDIVQKEMLLPLIDIYNKALKFTAIIPVSALKGDGIDTLLDVTIEHLVYGPKYYPDDVYTDQLERYMCQEIIREKLMKHTYEEIPQSLAGEVLEWKEKNRSSLSGRKKTLVSIAADIYVEKDSQKGIIIGKDGSKLKTASMDIRREIEEFLDAQVFLRLFVKVRKNWRKDEKVLRDLGYK